MIFLGRHGDRGSLRGSDGLGIFSVGLGARRAAAFKLLRLPDPGTGRVET